MRPADRSEITLTPRSFAAHNAAVAVRVRISVRHSIAASQAFPAPSYGQLAVNTRTVNRLGVDWPRRSFPSSTSTVAIQKRSIVTRAITLAPVAFPVQSSAVTVQVRDAVRHAITASVTFPACYLRDVGVEYPYCNAPGVVCRRNVPSTLR